MPEQKPLQSTIAPAETSQGDVADLSVATRGSTVLPDVRQDGDKLVVRPKERLRYEADSVLGRGGMGEVQLVRDHDIGRSVAVKKLIDHQSPQAVARFVDEVRITGRLEHPNIVPIHDVGVSDDGSLFFVMKYVEGETLGTVIKKLAEGDPEYQRKFSYESRLDLFAGLIRALQYAHSLGLLHRDVKPENIMVGPFGEVMLMDWGLAHWAERAPGTESTANTQADGTLVGTPAYMSPEQARGELSSLDARSDIYSAFVVLYELLTTQPYVEARTSHSETIREVTEKEPPIPLASVFSSNRDQPAVPTALRHFLRRGLSAKASDRFASATQVLDVLDRIRAGDCLVCCPTTFIQSMNTRFERFMDRHPFMGFGLFCLGVAAAASGILYWLSQML